MRNRLLWKILAINLPAIALVILIVWIAVDVLAANYFTELMHRYNIEPSETHAMFIHSVHTYLINASILAAVLAALLTYLLTRTVLRPLLQMTNVTKRVASGDYSARVPVSWIDKDGKRHSFTYLVPNMNQCSSAIPSTGWPTTSKRSSSCAGRWLWTLPMSCGHR